MLVCVVECILIIESPNVANEGVYYPMIELEELQQEINHLVYTTIKSNYMAMSDTLGIEQYSTPFIPRISPQYLENRFVILGQETDTWYPGPWTECGHLEDFVDAEEDDVERICLDLRYDDFAEYASGEGGRGGHFWGFTREIYRRNLIESDIHEGMYLSHCWMNLFMMEKVNELGKAGRTSQNWGMAQEVMDLQGYLVYEIFKLIQPKVILAMTSHKCDFFLSKYALGNDSLSFEPLGDFSYEDLATSEVYDPSFSYCPVHVIRTYHPNYFCQYLPKAKDKNAYKESIFEFLEQHLSPSWSPWTF